ncbi:MAG: hypothetical protein BWK78_02895 [Thiotrichaceae bacterium IS1]|nr:MAG: hypothetical protein BWK78_02895 [Thiotrichaceae bacterium IS1]
MNTLSLEYEQDFQGWINQHIALLKTGKVNELDVDHLIEELEGMATRDKNELVSHLVILMAHLLKWQFQFQKFAQTWPHAGEYAAKSWQYTIIEQRYRLKDQLENNPSLKRHLTEAMAKAYPKAVALAVDETGLPKKTFPLNCPYSLEQVLDKTFYPHPE